MTRFRYYLRTGCGTNQVDLSLDGATAQINISTRWMGEGEKAYAIHCRHRSISDCFGLLEVEKIEAGADEASLPPIELDPEEVLLPLVIEYLRTSTTPVYVHEASQLAGMAPLGYATWNEQFELVLLIHDSDWRARSSPLIEICDVLDKRKLESFTEEEPKKRTGSRSRR